MKRSVILASLVVAIFGAGLHWWVLDVHPATTTCTGTLTKVNYNDLVVPAGATCTVTKNSYGEVTVYGTLNVVGATIYPPGFSGVLNVEPGGTLNLTRARAYFEVDARGAAAVTLKDAWVEYGVDATGAGELTLTRSLMNGDCHRALVTARDTATRVYGSYDDC